MTDFNVLTLNARAFPGTAPMLAKLGDRVRIRIGNLSSMDHHPMHIHGHNYKVVATDGGPIPESAQWSEVSVLVQVGATRTVEFVANNPGDWAFHCHMFHHTMNQMGHGLPNIIGINPGNLDKKVRTFLPGYMTMGQDGMADMGDMGMKIPPNSVPMVGAQGPSTTSPWAVFTRTSKSAQISAISNRRTARTFSTAAGTKARPAPRPRSPLRKTSSETSALPNPARAS